MSSKIASETIATAMIASRRVANQTIGRADSIGTRGMSAPPTADRERRCRCADRVDQDIDRRPVAAADRALVDLVGTRVRDADRERQHDRLLRRDRAQGPPPEEAEQRV